MPVLLTSFKTAKHLGDHWSVYNVARRQPKDVNYESLSFLAPVDANGKQIHSDGRYNQITIGKYKADYFEALRSRVDMVIGWLANLDNDQHIALCCWCCPQQGKGKVWFEKTETFMCHTVLIGQLIDKRRPDVEVMLDADRQAYSVFKL